MLLLFSITTNAYALPDCPSDTSKFWDKCFGTIGFDNGDKYVGEWKDDKRHGQGTYTYSNGDKYVGEYKNDTVNGFGIFLGGGSDEFSGDF